VSEPLDWTSDVPRSRRFDDIYYAGEDGLAETRHVFLDGVGLPDAFQGRQRYVIGELGFGVGLNCLAAADLWRRRRPGPGAVLHLFSVEAYPLAPGDAARALSAFPELLDLAPPLLEAWPRGRTGLRRIEWPAERIVLDLFVGEAADGLRAWSGRADAWFLDGFAPAKNPEIWREEVLTLLAARSAPDARVATFTAAGAVRRGLEAAGFEMARRPGYGRKKESLHGRRGGLPAPASPAVRPLVVGAGIAGAALARAFARIGCGALLIDADGPGAGASGNPAALVAPRLDAGGGPEAALFAAAFARAVGLYGAEAPEAVLSRGVVLLAETSREKDRFARVLRQDLFEDALSGLGPAEAALALDEAEGPAGLLVRTALVIDPWPLLSLWGGKIRRGRVARLERAGGDWVCLDAAGDELGRSSLVCLAGGAAGRSLVPEFDLRALRGQVTLAAGSGPLLQASSALAYAAPTRDGVLFGATHDRSEVEAAARAEDDRTNLAALRGSRPALAARLEGVRLSGRASVRATTPDHLPLAGPVPRREGLYVLSGLGGRGFSWAPLLAEAVAAMALGAPGPLESDHLRRLSPARRGPPLRGPG
jgi:tRNA 5-methylaminomethyl-2-thiouridine biosynthesis bifunctional protein